MANITPMMQQYLKIHEQVPDAILFFRLGDFYEMFFDDAITASKVLDIVLTGKDCGMEERAPMCGVPYHAADNYIAKLVEKGFNNDSKIKDIKEYVTEHKKDNGSKFYSERKERGTVDRDNTNKEMAKAKNETEKLENEMENKKEKISDLMKNFFMEYGKDISLDLIHDMEDYIKRN